jgi:hypothetical protein
VRIRAAENSVEASLGESLLLLCNKQDRAAALIAASISLEGRYERDGAMHCLVASATIKLNGIEKSFDLGRFCIAIDGNCISGTKDLGSEFELEWELCVEDGGQKLCLYGKICKEFPYPVGNKCTPRGSICVSIDR